jgi:hypothetical protein
MPPFQNGRQHKNKNNNNKLLKIQKFKDFNGNRYLQGVRHAAPYGQILPKSEDFWPP